MEALLSAPYNPRNANRLAGFPPVGPTGYTGNMGSGNITQAASPMRVLALRDPVYPLWADSPTVDENWFATWKADGKVFTTSNGTSDIGLSATCTDLYDTNNSDFHVGTRLTPETAWGDLAPAQTSTFASLGERVVPMMTDPEFGINPFVYVPRMWDLTVLAQLGGDPKPGTWIRGDVVLEVWLRPGEVDIVTVSLLSGGTDAPWGYAKSTGLNTAKAVWVRPKSVDVTCTANDGHITVSLAVGSNTPMLLSGTAATDWPTLTYNGGPSNRLTPVSLMPLSSAMPTKIFTGTQVMLATTIPHSTVFQILNTTKVVNKEGTINAAALQCDSIGPWSAPTLTDSLISFALPYKRYVGLAADGLKGYVDPGANVGKLRNSLFMYNWLDLATPYFLPVLNVWKGDWFSMVSISDADLATASTYTVVTHTAWEFTADAPQLAMRSSTFSTLDVEKALRKLYEKMPFTKCGGLVLAQSGGAKKKKNRKKGGAAKPAKPEPKTPAKPAPKPKAKKP